jgi:hypothetical protein
VPAGWAGGARVSIRWFTSGGALISQTTGSTVATPAGVETQLVLANAIAPGTAARASIVPVLVGTPASSVLAYVGLASLGNYGTLVTSSAPVAGTDLFGNSYRAGFTTYNSGGAYINLDANTITIGVTGAVGDVAASVALISKSDTVGGNAPQVNISASTPTPTTTALLDVNGTIGMADTAAASLPATAANTVILYGSSGFPAAQSGDDQQWDMAKRTVYNTGTHLVNARRPRPSAPCQRPPTCPRWTPGLCTG